MEKRVEPNIFTLLIELYEGTQKWQQDPQISKEEFAHKVRSNISFMMSILLTTPLESSMRFQINIPEEENMFDRLALRHMELI